LKSFKYIFLVLICWGLKSKLSAQIMADAVLDSTRIRIGEQVKLDLYLNYPTSEKKIKIEWPEIGDTITGKIEVISVSNIDTIEGDKNSLGIYQQHRQIVISAYDSGYFAIPGFKFIINGDSTKPLITQSLFLEVHTVPTDTSATKLKDIKPLFDEKFNWKWYLSYIYWTLAILIAIAAIVLTTIYFTKRNKQKLIEPDKPKVPPHLTALAALEKIKAEQIWKEGYIKEYYSSISEVLRLYIEERFNVNALESTTLEIMKAFRTQVVDKISKEKLEQALTLSDLVKFAKLSPIDDEHKFTLQNAFDFVNGTKREEEIVIDESPNQNELNK
jgi:hypothetical protein